MKSTKMAESVLLKKISKLFRSVTFESYGREGSVVYHEGSKKLKFPMETGGNIVVFFLNIPSMKDWVASTGFDLLDREDILDFVAKTTQRKHAPLCRYEIKEAEIIFIKN